MRDVFVLLRASVSWVAPLGSERLDQDERGLGNEIQGLRITGLEGKSYGGVVRLDI